MNRKQLIVFASAILVGMLLIAMFLFMSRSAQDTLPEASITHPYDDSTEFDIDLSNVPEDDSKYSVYAISPDGLLSKSSAFGRKIGLSELDSSTTTYLGMTDNGEGALQYNQHDSTFFFRSPDGYTPSAAVIQANSGSVFESVLASFIKDIFDLDISYTDVVVDNVDGRRRISANISLDGMNIYTSSTFTNNEYIIVGVDGKVYEGKFTLLNVTEDVGQAGLVDPAVLSNLISRGEYPKDIQRVPVTLGDFPNSFDGDFGDYPGLLMDSLELDPNAPCVSSNIELGYYYLNSEQEFLSPTYRIVCTTELLYEGTVYPQDVIIFANALDPKYVSVESSE